MESTVIKPKGFYFSEKVKERLVSGICLIFIFLFMYTAYSKITDHQRFYNGIHNVKALSGVSLFLSWFVPVAEIIISILLIIPKTVKWGLISFTALMVVFTGYITSMLLWAKHLPCHCGGVIEKLSWSQHVWFNLAFIMLAVFALWLIKSITSYKILKK